MKMDAENGINVLEDSTSPTEKAESLKGQNGETECLMKRLPECLKKCGAESEASTGENGENNLDNLAYLEQVAGSSSGCSASSSAGSEKPTKIDGDIKEADMTKAPIEDAGGIEAAMGEVYAAYNGVSEGVKKGFGFQHIPQAHNEDAVEYFFGQSPRDSGLVRPIAHRRTPHHGEHSRQRDISPQHLGRRDMSVPVDSNRNRAIHQPSPHGGYRGTAAAAAAYNRASPLVPSREVPAPPNMPPPPRSLTHAGHNTTDPAELPIRMQSPADVFNQYADIPPASSSPPTEGYPLSAHDAYAKPAPGHEAYTATSNGTVVTSNHPYDQRTTERSMYTTKHGIDSNYEGHTGYYESGRSRGYDYYDYRPTSPTGSAVAAVGAAMQTGTSALQGSGASKKNHVLGIMNTPGKERRGEMLKPEENETWLEKNARSAAAYNTQISHVEHFCEALELHPAEALRFLYGQLGSRKLQDWMPFLVSRPMSFRMFVSLICDNLRPMSTDAFANYLVQKAIEICYENEVSEELEMLLSGFSGSLIFLAKQRYGCRVLDKALTVCSEERTRQYGSEVKGRMVECSVDQNANHVVQKILDVSDLRVTFLPEFGGHLRAISMDKYGCRVLQKIFDAIANEYKAGTQGYLHPNEVRFLDEMIANRDVLKDICFDRFGNFVVQYVIKCARQVDIQVILGLIEENLVDFCCHKFASNVMETMLQIERDLIKPLLMKYLMSNQIVGPNNDTIIHILARDEFGNFVIKKLITCLSDSELAELYEVKLKNMSLETSKYGKHIIFALRETNLFKNADLLDNTAQKQQHILQQQNTNGLPVVNNNMGTYVPSKNTTNFNNNNNNFGGNNGFGNNGNGNFRNGFGNGGKSFNNNFGNNVNNTFSPNHNTLSPNNNTFSLNNNTFSPNNGTFNPCASTFNANSQCFTPCATNFPSNNGCHMNGNNFGNNFSNNGQTGYNSYHPAINADGLIQQRTSCTYNGGQNYTNSNGNNGFAQQNNGNNGLSNLNNQYGGQPNNNYLPNNVGNYGGQPNNVGNYGGQPNNVGNYGGQPNNSGMPQEGILQNGFMNPHMSVSGAPPPFEPPKVRKNWGKGKGRNAA